MFFQVFFQRHTELYGYMIRTGSRADADAEIILKPVRGDRALANEPALSKRTISL
jgi:hypothetical protein